MTLYVSGGTAHDKYPDMGYPVSNDISTAVQHFDRPMHAVYTVQGDESDSMLAKIMFGSDSPVHQRMVRAVSHNAGDTVKVSA